MDGKRTLLHANHGIIVCTETVAEAFDYLYYLEKAAEITVKAMSTGRPLQLIPDDVCKMFHTDMEPPHLVKVCCTASRDLLSLSKSQLTAVPCNQLQAKLCKGH